MIAVAVLSYALPSLIGGNGYLSAYIVGIVLGNQQLPEKKSLVHFFDGLTSLMQMLIFFVLGLLAFPSRLPSVLLPAVIIGLFLTLVARPVAVAAILWPFRSKFAQQAVVSFAGLRGASSIVFAIVATVGSQSLENDVFHIVFCIVLLSISIQGGLLPLVSKKTQNDRTPRGMYSRPSTIILRKRRCSLFAFRLALGIPGSGLRRALLPLPPDTLLIFILRPVDPRGRGEAAAARRRCAMSYPTGGRSSGRANELALGAAAYRDDGKIKLTEVAIDEHHDWCGQRIAQLGLPQHMLIIFIRRGE